MLETVFIEEQFQSLLDRAQQAEQMYAALADSAEDPSVRAEMDQLRRDKQRHIRLAQRLLEIVE